MKVFLSWSGSQSRAVAEALFDWLPRVLQAVRPWLSSESIEPGQRWSSELAAELQANGYGILCLTPSSIAAPWVLFEAGALSKTVSDARVIPYLLCLTPVDLTGPFAQFQAILASRDDTLRLISALNSALGPARITDNQLADTFDLWWPRLNARLEAATQIGRDVAILPRRPLDEMVAELLDLTRAQTRRQHRDEQLLQLSDTHDTDILAEAQAFLNAHEEFADPRPSLPPAPVLRRGMRLSHPKFGPGRVISVTREALLGDQLASVKFDDSDMGTKRLYVRYANLTVESDGASPAPKDAT